MSVAENKALVAQIFEELAAGNSRALLSRVAEKSRWTVTGTSPVSKTFHSRQEFYEGALRNITVLLQARVIPTVHRILGEGDHVIVEWSGQATAKSGMPYNNVYCWVLTLRGGEIVDGMIYCDTLLVAKLLERVQP